MYCNFLLNIQSGAQTIAQEALAVTQLSECIVWVPLRVVPSEAMSQKTMLSRPKEVVVSCPLAEHLQEVAPQSLTKKPQELPRYFKELWRGEQAELNQKRAEKGLPPVDLGTEYQTPFKDPQTVRFMMKAPKRVSVASAPFPPTPQAALSSPASAHSAASCASSTPTPSLSQSASSQASELQFPTASTSSSSLAQAVSASTGSSSAPTAQSSLPVAPSPVQSVPQFAPVAAPAFDLDPAYDWSLHARPNQRLPEGDWSTWLVLAGRGFGKTRTGAESIRQLVDSGVYRRIAIIGKTLEEVRSVMIEGASGLLAVYAPNDPNRPTFDFRNRRVKWPNGAIAELFDADRPDRLRGPQFDLAWVDEFAKFRRPESFFNQLSFTLRLGTHPRCIITTTPRSTAFLQKLAANPTTVVTRGSTFDNADNLSASFLDNVRERFAGTQIGQQEIYAEFLSVQEHALWQRNLIVHQRPEAPLPRIVIAIDPAMTTRGDETGIVVAGRDGNRAFVLEDASGHYAPMEWAQIVAQLYKEYEGATIVAEVNQGGDLVEAMLRTVVPDVRYKAVHASRGKVLRAEPIVALYEQGRVFHARPFDALEFQMCSFEGNGNLCGEEIAQQVTDVSRNAEAPGLSSERTNEPASSSFAFYTLDDDEHKSCDGCRDGYGTPLLPFWKKFERFLGSCRFARKSALIGLNRTDESDPDAPSSPTTFDFGDDFEEHPSPDRMDALVWALTELFDLEDPASDDEANGVFITMV